MSTIQARRFTRIGRTAAAALGLSAATLWAFNVPVFSSSLPSPSQIPVAAPQSYHLSIGPAAAVDRQSLAATADRLTLGANVKPPAPSPEVASQPEPPPPSGPEWTYLGQITEPNRRLALISVEGHQRILAEGRAYGQTRLLSIASDQITIHDASGDHEISRAAQSDTRVAWLRNMPAAAPPANNTLTPGTAVAIAQQAALAREARDRVGYQTFREREEARRGRGRNRDNGPQG